MLDSRSLCFPNLLIKTNGETSAFVCRLAASQIAPKHSYYIPFVNQENIQTNSQVVESKIEQKHIYLQIWPKNKICCNNAQILGNKVLATKN